MKDETFVGAVFGRLTVVSLKPFHCLCSCGTLVTSRRLSHLVVASVRSCGCGRPSVDLAERAAQRNQALVRCVNPDDKMSFRRWVVKCKNCSAVTETNERTIKFETRHKFGCYACFRKAQAISKGKRGRYGVI